MHTHRMGNGAPDFELATDASSRRLPTRPLLAPLQPQAADAASGLPACRRLTSHLPLTIFHAL